MSWLSDTTGFLKVLGYPVAYFKGLFDGKKSQKDAQKSAYRKLINRVLRIKRRKR